MRIHELLEACLEYVAYDGVLGADPATLRSHLEKLDSNVDADYFSYVWSLLARHPNLQVAIAADALPTGDVGAPTEERGPSPAAEPADGERELFTVLGDDDAGTPPVAKTDLGALLQRYPQRVRIRCTDDEIYYRLTGSRRKIPKISPMIFLFLQLAARSREHGVTALELGPMTGSTQNSVYHYLKVLVQLGLCAKIPATVHGSSTSVLVYRRFVEQNVHYLANIARDVKTEPPTAPATPAQYDDDDEVLETAEGSEARTIFNPNDLGFNFQPFSELELNVGHIPKERLIRVLDHPSLKNHLLGNHHLLGLIGWPINTWEVRHRRTIQRHLHSLVAEGIIEFVDTGANPRGCLRLTKYNPNIRPKVKAEPTLSTAEGGGTGMSFSVDDYTGTFQWTGKAIATESTEFQVLACVYRSANAGCIYSEITHRLNHLFKRTVEHVLNRHDLAYLPPHLRHKSIRCAMENFHRQRRLRVYTTDAYQRFMEVNGAPLQPQLHAEEGGRWAEIFRPIAESVEAHYNMMTQLAAITAPVGPPTGTQQSRAKADVRKRTVVRKRRLGQVPPEEPEVKPNKYSNDAQERGRPRKYTYVVNQDGTRNRVVIGQLFATKTIPEVLIYYKEFDRLVPAPVGYSGVGIPPPITAEEVLATGKEPSFFDPFPGKDKPKKVAVKAAKAAPKGKRKSKAAAQTDDATESPQKKPKTTGEEAAERLEQEKLEKTRQLEAELAALTGKRVAIAPRGRPLAPAPAATPSPSRGPPPNAAAGPSRSIAPGPAGSPGNFEPPAPMPPGAASPATPSRMAVPRGPAARRIAIAPARVSSPLAAAAATPQVAMPLWNGGPSAPPQSPLGIAPGPHPAAHAPLAPSAAPTGPPTPSSAPPAPVPTPTPATKKRARQTRYSVLPGEANQAGGPGTPTEAATPPAKRARRGDGEVPIMAPPVPTEPQMGEASGTHAVPGPSAGGAVAIAQPPAPGQAISATHPPLNETPPAGLVPSGVPVAGPQLPGPLAATPGPSTSAGTPTGVDPLAAGAQPSTPTANSVALQAPPIQDPALGSPLKKPQAAATRAGAGRGKGTGSRAKGKQKVEEDEPLKSVSEVDLPKPVVERRKPQTGRVNIAEMRRRNEVYQCLVDSGGVASETKLFLDHKQWTEKWVGTDHPYAPLVVSGMDRKVHRRVLDQLIGEERIGQTYAHIPTTTGRWMKMAILFAKDRTEVEIQAYIRALANQATAGLAKPTAVSVPNAQFSSVKRTTRNMNAPSSYRSRQPSAPPQAAGLSKRDIFLHEPPMAACLYGYKLGRCLRAEYFHGALMDAIVKHPDSPHLISSGPRVFALPFIYDELRIRDFFACVPLHKWDEDLYNWLQVPGNGDLRFSEIPPHLRTRQSLLHRVNQGGKNMIRTLTSLLCYLQLLLPMVAIEDEAAATVRCPDAPLGQPTAFTQADDFSTATYFLVHDVVPIYSVSEVPVTLFGVMEARTSAQVPDLWRVLKNCSLGGGVLPHLPRLAMPPFPFAPTISPTLDLGGADYIRTLRARSKWRHEIRIVPQQKEALNAAINSGTGERLITPEQLQKLAWDNALTPQYVDDYLTRRSKTVLGEGPSLVFKRSPNELHRQRAAERKVKANKQREEAEKKALAIRDQVALRIAAARVAYDERVKAAAERAGAEVTQDFKDYMIHNRPMTKLGEMPTDGELDAIVQSFERFKSGVAAPRRANVSGRPAPSIRHVKRTTRVQPKHPDAKLRRYRHNWTREEEELLIDAEAVIRARCRGTTNRGRPAMSQIFPQLQHQVVRSKIKKLLEIPGREAYFRRLEDSFYSLLIEHRGSAELPDPNPGSHVDFDVRAHVNFLRQRINKNHLRLPVAITPVSDPTSQVPELASSPAEMISKYTWDFLKSVSTGYDQVLDNPLLAEDTKLHNISLGSVTEENPVAQEVAMMSMSRRAGVIRALLKMIVATPNEEYSINAAANLLNVMPKQEYEPQIAALVNEGVLLKHPHLKHTGRMYAFNSAWLFTCEGNLPPTMDKQVAKAQDIVHGAEGDDVVWPIVGDGGEIAVLMNMVSNFEADLEFNAGSYPLLRQGRMTYNTRALNDDSFEVAIKLKRTAPPPKPTIGAPSPFSFPALLRWDADAHSSASDEHISLVVGTILHAGPDGLDRSQLRSRTGLPNDRLDAVLAALALEPEPRVFWAGYDNARVIARKFWGDWTLDVKPKKEGDSAAEPAKCAPRRWVTIWGGIIETEWHRAIKAATGQLTLRPGITERLFRERLAPVIDRQETTDILQYLIDTGMATRKWATPSARTVPPVQAADNEDARGIVWHSTPRLFA
ncbi:hypothetical protein Q8F55_001849 [Vanrija albida]|uniref:B-block binding subunit of TFIIIC domain-containing protein n=1 Tax=Vanrija albida TaxID=181172 RepID=A0ABR3Q846_9TREE